jgi:hypothetical protein
MLAYWLGVVAIVRRLRVVENVVAPLARSRKVVFNSRVETVLAWG